METTNVRRSLGKTESSPDPSWRGLYQIGGISAALYVTLLIIPFALLATAPSPPLSDGAAVLQYIASHKLVYTIYLVSLVGLSLPAIVVFLALYMALKHLNKSYAALGALIAISSEIIALAYNSSPPSLHTGLINLSDHYMAATTTAQQATIATAAESLIAITNAVNTAGILTALGILIISLVSLKGVMPKGIAYLGIATGFSGIIFEALRDIIGLGYVTYGLLLLIWFPAVGWKLYRLGQLR
jgi:hypothetical protein